MPTIEAAFYARVSGEQQVDAQTILSQIAALRERIASDEVLFHQIESLLTTATAAQPLCDRPWSGYAISHRLEQSKGSTSIHRIA